MNGTLEPAQAGLNCMRTRWAIHQITVNLELSRPMQGGLCSRTQRCPTGNPWGVPGNCTLSTNVNAANFPAPFGIVQGIKAGF
jgi:hypothetical protein